MHRRMAPAAGAPIVALGEDLLREVLIHLPSSTDLLRAAAACKPFLRAARNKPFLRRFRRRHPSSCPRLLGCLLLFPNRRSGCKSHFVPISGSTCPSSSSSSSSAAAAADDGDFALSFLPGGGWLAQGAATWKHLDCRNGRLLLENLGSHELAVADPISRHYVSLPAPTAGRAVGYGLFADDGDSSQFRVVCVSRAAATSPELRALVLASGELSWSDVAGVACQPDLAAGSRVMQANRSLYWRLEGGERMVAFSTASMELSVVELPPALRNLRFDTFDREEEDSNVLHLLTMTGYRIEVWAGTADGDGELAWKQVEKSLRFHKALTQMIDPSLESYERINPSEQSYRDDIHVIGVADGLVLFRKWTHIFSIDIKTMKLKRLPKADCLGALIYPYTIAWPPSLLNPAGQGISCLM